MNFLMTMAVLLAALELGPARPLSDPVLVPESVGYVRVVAGRESFLVISNNRYTLLDAHGRPLLAHPRLLESQPGAVWDGHNFLLATTGNKEVHLIRVDGTSGESSELPPVATETPVAGVVSDGLGYLLLLSDSRLQPLDLNGVPRSAPFSPGITIGAVASADGDGYLLMDTAPQPTTVRVTSFGSVARRVDRNRIPPSRLLFDGVQFVALGNVQDRVLATVIDREGRSRPDPTTVAIGSLINVAPGFALIKREGATQALPLGFGGVPLAPPRPLSWPAEAVASLPNGDGYFVSHLPVLGSVLSPSLEGPPPVPPITKSIEQTGSRLASLGEGQQAAFWSEGTNVYATRSRNGQPLDGRGLLVAQNVTAWRVIAGDRGRALLAWQELNSGTASIFARTIAIDTPPSPPLLIVSNAHDGDAIRLAAAAPAESGWAVVWIGGVGNRLTFLDDAATVARPSRAVFLDARHTVEPLELFQTPDGFLAVLRESDRFFGGASGAVTLNVAPLGRSGAPSGPEVLLPNSWTSILSACPTPDGGAALLFGTSGSRFIATIDQHGAVGGTTATFASRVFRTSRSVILADSRTLWTVNPDASLSELLVLPDSGPVAIAPGALLQATTVNDAVLGFTTRLFLRTLNE